MTYPLIFLSAFLVSVLTTPLFGRLGARLGLVDLPSGRRQHARPIARIGGVGLFVGFAAAAGLTLWLSPPPDAADLRRIWGVVAGCVFVFFVGLLDDRYDLKPTPQLAAQFAAALIAIAATVFIERFTNPLDNQIVELNRWPVFGPALVFVFTVFWIMGMMNTVNWLDGLDGLAAGVGAIAAALFALHAYRLGQTELALYPLGLAGACLGFLVFNFHPARVFLGSAGTMTLGFALATLSILAPARAATALLVMAVPIVDTAWQILNRWREGRSPLSGDRGHLHFRLVDLGLDQRWIVLAYWGFCAAFGGLALLTSSRLYKLIALLTLGLIVLALLAYLSRSRRR